METGSGFWLFIVLAVLTLLAMPWYPYSRGWGYRPAGALLGLFVLLAVIFYLGVLSAWR